MLENQIKKILLLSDDPADVSFLSEIAVTQQADLELVRNASDLCLKIALYRADESLAAIFIDVTAPEKLRRFEHEFQSKMSHLMASEISRMTHYISGLPLIQNKEILSSPYFSFYSERINTNFKNSVEFYQNSFYQTAEINFKEVNVYDKTNASNSFDKIKKEFIAKGFSTEWILQFKDIWNESVKVLFPFKFECSSQFSNNTLKIKVKSDQPMNKERIHPENFLSFGISMILSKNSIILFLPVYKEVAAARNNFRFLKVES